jgi:hypothetical protein
MIALAELMRDIFQDTPPTTGGHRGIAPPPAVLLHRPGGKRTVPPPSKSASEYLAEDQAAGADPTQRRPSAHGIAASSCSATAA